MAAPLQHVLDVDRHGGEEVPSGPIPKPKTGSPFKLDHSVIEALPIAGTKVLLARSYGMSLWGQTARIDAQLPGGETKAYFLKTVSLGDLGHVMVEGEFESLRAIHAACPGLVPCPYGWGKFRDQELSSPDTYFLLAEFLEVGTQPPDAENFTARIAELHKSSVSPTGKFGFHVTTCHAKLPQVTDWEESWAVLYKRQLGHMIKMDVDKNGDWPEFSRICNLVLDKVIPRLLEPLQSDGRSIKPCLVHGDLWDENTATNTDTGEPFIFDAGSFYAHNEYEIGNWRAARHRLSHPLYIQNYKNNFPVSEPRDEWDDRNLLYSLRFNLGTAILIPECRQRQVVMHDMTTLCLKYCPDDVQAVSGRRVLPSSNSGADSEGRRRKIS